MTTANLGIKKRPEVGFDLLSEISELLHADLSAISRASKSLQATAVEDASSGDHQEKISRISDTCAGLLCAVGQIMDIANLEHGRLDFTEQRLSLGEMLDNAYNRIISVARGNGIAISTLNAAADLYVVSDRASLDQIIDNLLANALRETPEGGTVAIHAGVREDGHAFLSVTDTGDGIDPAERQKVCEPFAKREFRPGDDHSGLGLELPIAGRLTAAIGCELALETHAGSGSTFEIVFPKAKTEGLPESALAAAG